jgi:predicted RNA-binding Zn ribbon-like protein
MGYRVTGKLTMEVTHRMDEGPLRVVREFVNTLDLERAKDALSAPDDLAKWLRQNDLLGPDDPVTDIDLTRAIELREAIRELLGGADMVAHLNTAARRSRLRPEFQPAGTVRLVPASTGVDRAAGELLVLITEAMSDGRWRRLKICANDGCRWAFYDLSRAGAGKWCSMAVCGNRNKAAAWRARRRDG